jgi:G3E family GTPase
MASAPAIPIPITIVTGFLGAGKTTLILNLIPQLPAGYRLALLKNEFGSVEVDSRLARAGAVAGVAELLGGCICCNLVGALSDALVELRDKYAPDRIVVETSGSAFPATLAMEVNRVARETGSFALDGVVSVLDVENWTGYGDTSVTAKLQAQYTDLIVLNKWEAVSEDVYERCIDRILDLQLDIPTPRVRSDAGCVDKDLLLGLDAKLARTTRHGEHHHHVQREGEHDHDGDHHSEVEVLSVLLASDALPNGVDLEMLEGLLSSAPKDEVYRVKGILYSLEAPCSSAGDCAEKPPVEGMPHRYVLNWAFGRWTFTAIPPTDDEDDVSGSDPNDLLRMTVVTAKYEGEKWKKRLESGEFLGAARDPESAKLEVSHITRDL